MTLQQALDQFKRAVSDPPNGYITADRAQAAIEIIYQDMLSNSAEIFDFNGMLLNGALEEGQVLAYNGTVWTNSGDIDGNSTSILVRRAPSGDWQTFNPVLKAGELGLESNTKRFKFGDGITAWNSLPYGVDFSEVATAAQGAKADTAVQPGDLGSAALTSASDYATAAQGSLAASAAQTVNHYLTPNQASGGDTLAETTGFGIQTGSATLAYTTAESYIGSGSIRMTLDPGATFAFVKLSEGVGIPVKSQESITFRVAMKIPTGVEGSLRLQWRDDAGSAVGGAVSLDVKPGNDDWQVFSGTSTCPAGATRANHFFGVTNASGGESVYIDRISMEDNLSLVKVDQSVGRRIFTWDTVNNRWQMTWGDTGWRQILAFDSSGTITEGAFHAGGFWQPRPGNAGFVWARRTTDSVHVWISNIKSTQTNQPDPRPVLTLPVGFRLAGFNSGPGRFTQTASITLRDPSTGASVAGVASSQFLETTLGVGAYGTQLEIHSAMCSMPTIEPWPSSLPGTPVASIPVS